MTTALVIVFAVMLAAAAVGLAIPLIRHYDAAACESDTIIAVIREQFAEVDGQVASGQVSGDAAVPLRAELKRRLLTEKRARPLAVRLLSDRGAVRLALILGTVTALAATAIYAVDGRPDLAGSSAQTVAAEVAAATGAAPAPIAATPDSVDSLKARTATAPNDAEAWRLLATAYFADQRFSEAAAAFGRAVALRPREATLLSAQGEALAQAGGGIVTPSAHTAFATAAAIDASDPRARYFLALERDQHGDHAGAIDSWVALLNGAPADAPWAPELRRFVEQAARDAKIDLGGRLRTAAPLLAGAANARGPDAAAVTAAGGMTEAGRAAFIGGMVDSLAAKLAANPRDADGWIRLIRARKVMGDNVAAETALNRGRAAFGNDPAAAKTIVDAAAGMGVR